MIRARTRRCRTASQLESQLTDDDATEDGDGDSDAVDDADVDEDPVGDPAEPRAIDVGESFEREGLEITVERLVAHEFHTEVEFSAVNRTADDDIVMVRDSSTARPALFDDRDRRFAYQHPAGTDSVTVGPGSRLEMTAAFRGAIQSDAELVTFQVQLETWAERDDVEVQIPVAGS